MDLPLDIWRLVLLNCRINDIKSLYLLNKTFHSLCNEKSIWLEKFKEKDLIIISNDINDVSHYYYEYKKISLAAYTTDYLLNYTQNFHCSCHFGYINFHFKPFIYDYFNIKDLRNILTKDHWFLEEVDITSSKYEKVCINVKITMDQVSIDYDLYIKNSMLSLTLNNVKDNKESLISLMNKIFYYYPKSIVYDNKYERLLVNTSNTDYYNEEIHNKRKVCWDKYYSKYEELYF